MPRLFLFVFLSTILSFDASAQGRPSIPELNKQLTIKLKKDFEDSKAALSRIRSTSPAIKESLKLFSEFNVQQFEARLKKDFTNRLIPAWLEHQAEDTVLLY